MSAVKVGQWLWFAPKGRTYGEGGASSVSSAAIPTGASPYADEPWLKFKLVTEAGVKNTSDGSEKVMAPPDDLGTGAYGVAAEIPGANQQEWTFQLADTTGDHTKAILFGRADLTGTLSGSFKPNEATQWEGWARIVQKDNEGNDYATHVLWVSLSNAGEVKLGNKIVSHGIKLTVLDNANNLTDPAP